MIQYLAACLSSGFAMTLTLQIFKSLLSSDTVGIYCHCCYLPCGNYLVTKTQIYKPQCYINLKAGTINFTANGLTYINTDSGR